MFLSQNRVSANSYGKLAPELVACIFGIIHQTCSRFIQSKFHTHVNDCEVKCSEKIHNISIRFATFFSYWS